MASVETIFARRFGREVQAWREFRGLSRAKLGARIGRPAKAISAIERGRARTSVKTLHRLATVFDVDPEMLLDVAMNPPLPSLRSEAADRPDTSDEGECTADAAPCEEGKGVRMEQKAGQRAGSGEGQDADAEPDPEDDETGSDWTEEVDPCEAQILEAICARERSPKPKGFPDEATVRIMEEPLRHLVRASMLFYDLAAAARGAEEIRPPGLVLLSNEIEEAATRLFRLYHGHPPSLS